MRPPFCGFTPSPHCEVAICILQEANSGHISYLITYRTWKQKRLATMTDSGIFEACLTTTNQDDTTGLLQCISDKLEFSQSVTSKTMNSYLLVLSVSCGRGGIGLSAAVSRLFVHLLLQPARVLTHIMLVAYYPTNLNHHITSKLQNVGCPCLLYASRICHALCW